MLARQENLDGFEHTRRRRMALSLPDETDDVITEIAEHLGITKTQLVQNIVNDSMPILKKTLTVARGLKSLKDKGMMGTIAALLRGDKDDSKHAKPAQ